jgi:hypothetical protein
MKLFLTLTAGLLLAPLEARGQLSQPGRFTINNGIVSVSYDSSQGTFTASRDGRVFLKHGRFQEALGTPTVRKVRIDDAFGAGKAIQVAFPSRYVYTLAVYDNVPFVCVRVLMRNSTDEPLLVDAVTPVRFAVDLGRAVKDLRVLGCDRLTTAEADRASYTFLAVAEPGARSGVVCGWLTHDRASGIVSSKQDNGLVAVEARSEYGRLLVPAGGNAEGETLAIGYFDNALLGLEEYAETIAEIYEIKLPEIPSGYCTWYSRPHGGASDEKHMAELADFCARNLRKFGFEVLQIDDKWQISRRDFTTYNPKGPYPSGMKLTADRIKAAGLMPGIWFIPFGWDPERPVFADHQDWFVHKDDGSIYTVHWAGSCLDMTHPEARRFLRQVISRMTRQWGYDYIKIDGLWTGMAVKILYPKPTYRPDNLGDAVFHDPAKTNMEAYRDGLKLVREACGKDVYILGCNVAQNMRTLGASIGLLDGMRIGSDTGARWGAVLRGAAMGSRLYFLHNRVWHNDPDCLMLREPLTLGQARAWGSSIALSGQLNLVSEWLPGLPADKLDVLKRSMPNHGLCARPVDLFENDPAQIWHLAAGTDEQRRDVIGLFNWDDKKPDSLTVEMSTLNLPNSGNGTYVGFDYWANEFVGPFDDVLEVELRPSSCRLISIRPLLERPVLLGTSRHVTQGIVDVTEQAWNNETSVLTGKSRVVGADPYELRIFAPGSSRQIADAGVSQADIEAGVTVETRQTGREIRITIDSRSNRHVRWKAAFKN